MIVYVSEGRASLDQAEDFRRFSVACVGARPEATPAGVDGVSFESPDVAWVSVDALVGMHGAAATPEWRQALAGMIEKARPHGWISPDGRSIRAHVTWGDTPAS